MGRAVIGVARSDHDLGKICAIGRHDAVCHNAPEAVRVDHRALGIRSGSYERSTFVTVCGHTIGWSEMRSVDGLRASCANLGDAGQGGGDPGRFRRAGLPAPFAPRSPGRLAGRVTNRGSLPRPRRVACARLGQSDRRMFRRTPSQLSVAAPGATVFVKVIRSPWREGRDEASDRMVARRILVKTAPGLPSAQLKFGAASVDVHGRTAVPEHRPAGRPGSGRRRDLAGPDAAPELCRGRAIGTSAIRFWSRASASPARRPLFSPSPIWSNSGSPAATSTSGWRWRSHAPRPIRQSGDFPSLAGPLLVSRFRAFAIRRRHRRDRRAERRCKGAHRAFRYRLRSASSHVAANDCARISRAISSTTARRTTPPTVPADRSPISGTAPARSASSPARAKQMDRRSARRRSPRSCRCGSPTASCFSATARSRRRSTTCTG